MRCSRMFLASASCLCLAVSQFAQAQPVGSKVIIKTSPAAAAAGLKTCNVYVTFSSAADVLLSVGFSNISTDDPLGFFQVAGFGGDLPPNNLFCPIVPLLCDDSFVTIGTKNASASLSVDPDFNTCAFNCMPQPPCNPGTGLPAGCGQLVGGWFAVPIVPPLGTPDPITLQVLVAQLTIRNTADNYDASGSFTAFYNQGQAFQTAFSCFGEPPCGNDDDCNGLDTDCADGVCVSGDCVSVPKPLSTFCDSDGSACTIEHCDGAGACVLQSTVMCPGPTNSCDGGQSCDPATGNCVDNPDASAGTPCGNSSNNPPCDLADTCDGAGNCQSNTAPDGTACSDGLFCNGNDSCVAGACTGPGTTGDPCAGGAECNNCCNEAADNCFCAAGTACGSGSSGQCDNPDSCNATGTCLANNKSGPCSDGNACTTNDTCSGGSCVGGPPPNCNDNNVCTDDSCVAPGGCVNTPDDTNTCSDGNDCTSDACSGGNCVSTPIPGCCNTNADCSDGVDCTDDVCDTATGNCSNTPDDGACDDGNECTFDECDAGSGCVYADNNGASCDDGNPCTSGDTCSGSSCSGTPECTSDLDCDTAAGEVCTAQGCCAAPGVEYALDIREKKCPNKLKCNSNGTIKVYIAGDADSDVNLIDLDTLELCVCGTDDCILPDKPPRIKDKVGPHFTQCGDCSCQKLKKDYIADVEIKFKHLCDVIDPNLPEGSLVDWEVRGNLLDGTPLKAHDCTVIDRPGSGQP